MKNTQLINLLAVSVEKISYLFKSIRRKNAQPKQLEVALLKQYVLELYDQVLELEKESTVTSDTTSSSIGAIQTKIAEQVKSAKEAAEELPSMSEITFFDGKEEEEVQESESTITTTEASESKDVDLTVVEEEDADEDSTPIIEEESNEEILEIETVYKEEIVEETVEEVVIEVDEEESVEIEDEEATSLMNVDSAFLEEKLEETKEVVSETIEEEHNEMKTGVVVVEETVEKISEDIPIAEKLKRTLAKLQETEQASSDIVNPSVSHESINNNIIVDSEEDATTVINTDYLPKQTDVVDLEEDATTLINTDYLSEQTDAVVDSEEDATLIINSSYLPKEPTNDLDLDEGATTIINPIGIKEEYERSTTPEPKVELPAQPILTDDNSVRTQILEDIVKSSEFSEKETHDLIVDSDVGDDETMALELNDVLAKNSIEHSGGVRRLDISFNQRFAFINQLFKGDNGAYEKAIDDIAGSEGYIQALTYVNLNLVHDYGWDSDDSIVKDFKEVIRKCFLD